MGNLVKWDFAILGNMGYMFTIKHSETSRHGIYFISMKLQAKIIQFSPLAVHLTPQKTELECLLRF